MSQSIWKGKFILCGLIVVLCASVAAAQSSGDSPDAQQSQDAQQQSASEPEQALAQESEQENKNQAGELLGLPVKKLIASVEKSVVVIKVGDRDGQQRGIGTGFVVDKKGLVATNLHVIGEARPLQVILSSGTKLDVQAVYATDKTMDLALLQVEANDLPDPLPLADSDKISKGDGVVVFGNPQGLRQSVVVGVVSGKRNLENREMIQLAVPIESGNSGGPVIDAQGRVLGIVTMKSVVTNNLGFAVGINSLLPLLEKPNPVPMPRWLTIGSLDSKKWKPLFGARWQQRAGHIHVNQSGAGFGGRSLCLWQGELPELPYEIGVRVRLDDEAGAAGLVFHSDGEHKHYGFYPSAGKLRLTRFNGTSVYNWRVLHNEFSKTYLRGKWNHLKVRVEKGKISCYVNDQLLYETTDDVLPVGQVGLAKFRQTEAEFRDFRIARKLPPSQLSQQQIAEVSKAIDKLESLRDIEERELARFTENSKASVDVMLRRAKQLEQRAVQLRLLASQVHVRAVANKLKKLFEKDEKEIDLCEAALLVAQLDNEEIDVDAYLKQIDEMAGKIKESFKIDSEDQKKLARLNEYLFELHGFHGSRTEYYHKANSHLNRVIDDREGLPITLSVLYIGLGQRLGLEIEGVGMPGHFVARFVPQHGEKELIDVFDRGKKLTRQDAARIVADISGLKLEEKHLRASTKHEIVQRLLANLLNLARRKVDKIAMSRYLDALVALSPDDISQRGMRAVVSFELGRRDTAISDLDRILAAEPEGIDLENIRRMREFFLNTDPPDAP